MARRRAEEEKYMVLSLAESVRHMGFFSRRRTFLLTTDW
jgi:hypothetical protein